MTTSQLPAKRGRGDFEPPDDEHHPREDRDHGEAGDARCEQGEGFYELGYLIRLLGQEMSGRNSDRRDDRACQAPT